MNCSLAAKAFRRFAMEEWNMTFGKARMDSMSAHIQESLHTLAEQLPEGAIWKDVAFEAYVRQEVEAGLDEARCGEFATEDELKSAFAKWGVRLETEVDTPSAWAAGRGPGLHCSGESDCSAPDW